MCGKLGPQETKNGKSDYRVRQRELDPPGNWFAPPGSNQSSGGGQRDC
jgi:hypothetical protein